MPVTKTAKRALRSSERKADRNKLILKKLEITLRKAKKEKDLKSVIQAVSQTDKAAKKGVIHANKAARLKSHLVKLLENNLQKSKKNKKPNRRLSD